jgi:hypothetical protein
MSDGTLEQRILVHLHLEGQNLGIWDSWNGGDKDTESVQYRAGGHVVKESLGGGTIYTNLTIARNYRLSRDRKIEEFLSKWVGNGRVVAGRQMLDRMMKAWGKPVIVTGILKTYTPPVGNSDGNNAAMITVVIEPNSFNASQ